MSHDTRMPSIRLFVIGLVLGLFGACTGSEPETSVRYVFESSTPRGSTWFKGNTHAHTTNSDGDTPPHEVAAWYRDHGYDFLVLSDHNVFTDPRGLPEFATESFLLLPGEEVTSSFEGAPVHVNALNIPELVEARSDTSLVATIQSNVDAIRAVDGVPHINHPNFRWAFGFQELIQVEGDRLLEIWNGHPLVHNQGVPSALSVERVWDQLLSSGKEIYGIAVDDAHHFQGEFAADRANPGRGWVVVRAPSLDASEIVWALEQGHFYASTGPVIDDVVASGSHYTVSIRPEGDFRYVTYFIGDQGRILAAIEGTEPSYELLSPLRYVRARVVDSQGRSAWTQPAFVGIQEGVASVAPVRFLALGDSYTVGEGVDARLSWPAHLARDLRQTGIEVEEPEIIARTGWTTDELIEGIEDVNPEGSYDLVSLLIGVNDQYRGRTLDEYRDGFAALLSQAVEFSDRGAEGVFVVSIPDWGVTPFASDRDGDQIAREIDAYNAAAKELAQAAGATWIGITDLSRLAAHDKSFVTADDLHLESPMYEMWVQRMLPTVQGLLDSESPEP